MPKATRSPNMSAKSTNILGIVLYFSNGIEPNFEDAGKACLLLGKTGSLLRIGPSLAYNMQLLEDRFGKLL